MGCLILLTIGLRCTEDNETSITEASSVKTSLIPGVVDYKTVGDYSLKIITSELSQSANIKIFQEDKGDDKYPDTSEWADIITIIVDDYKINHPDINIINQGIVTGSYNDPVVIFLDYISDKNTEEIVNAQ